MPLGGAGAIVLYQLYIDPTINTPEGESRQLFPPLGEACLFFPGEYYHKENKLMPTINTTNLEEIQKQLAAPFPLVAINWKPQTISKSRDRALAVAYIDARDVAERLDEVVGPLNWQVDHKMVGDQLMTGIGIHNPETGEWVWKWDAGFNGSGFTGNAEGSDEDKAKEIKGTVSDGLKRAGVQWGIARSLYRFPKVWVDWDDDHRSFCSTPLVPEWYLDELTTAGLPAEQSKSVAHKPAGNGNGTPVPATPTANGNGHSVPASNGNGYANNGNGNGITIKNPGEPASESQVKAIFAIAKSKGVLVDEVVKKFGKAKPEDLNKGEASAAINYLNSLTLQ